MEQIVFSDKNLFVVEFPHNDAVIITLNVIWAEVRRFLSMQEANVVSYYHIS